MVHINDANKSQPSFDSKKSGALITGGKEGRDFTVLNLKDRFGYLILASSVTVFSLGLALLFDKTRQWWSCALNGRKVERITNPQEGISHFISGTNQGGTNIVAVKKATQTEQTGGNKPVVTDEGISTNVPLQSVSTASNVSTTSASGAKEVKQSGNATSRIGGNKPVVVSRSTNDTQTTKVEKAGDGVKNPSKKEIDKSVALAAVTKDGFALEYLSPALKKDYDVVLAAVRKNGSALQYADESLRNHPEIVRAALVDKGPLTQSLAIQYIGEKLKSDSGFIRSILDKVPSAIQFVSVNDPEYKKLALEAVTKDGLALEYLSPELKKDYDVVLAAVRKNGSALQYADESLRNHPEIVKAALVDKGPLTQSVTIQYIGEELKTNSKFIGSIVDKVPLAIQFVSVNDPEYKKLALEAVTKDGLALEYLSPALKKDYDVVLAAVRQNGYALQYADESLRNHPEIVRAAIIDKGQLTQSLTIQYIGEKLKSDSGFIRSILDKVPSAIQFVSVNDPEYKKLALEAVSRDGRTLEHLSLELKKDREIVLAAVRQNGSALQYADETLRNNAEIVEAAIAQNPYAIKYIGVDLKADRQFIISIVDTAPQAVAYLNPTFAD